MAAGVPMSPTRRSWISKRYGRVDTLVNLALDVAEGEAGGYLGPDGAGKTTTICPLLDVDQPIGGERIV